MGDPGDYAGSTCGARLLLRLQQSDAHLASAPAAIKFLWKPIAENSTIMRSLYLSVNI
jgi:hypothetical protein